MKSIYGIISEPELPTGHFFWAWPSLQARPKNQRVSCRLTWLGLQDKSGQWMFLIFQTH
jgi:hypothetical protein